MCSLRCCTIGICVCASRYMSLNLFAGCIFVYDSYQVDMVAIGIGGGTGDSGNHDSIPKSSVEVWLLFDATLFYSLCLYSLTTFFYMKLCAVDCFPKS